MRRYLLARLIAAIPVMLGVTFLAFLTLHLMPGDPVKLLVGSLEASVSEERLEEIRAHFNLDRPLYAQYGMFLLDLARGDLGVSILKSREVTTLIFEALPSTIELAVASAMIAMILGMSLGLVAAVGHGTWADSVSSFLSLVAVSAPEFWLAMLAVLVTSVHFGWFPTSGDGGLHYLILPAAVLGTQASASIARITRSSMLEAMNQPYVMTARAKGLSRTSVIWHAARNALMPLVTISGLEFGRLLGGTVVIETIFNRNGIGKLLIDSILQKDLPVLRGCLIFIAAVYILINIAVDISYSWINPKVEVR